MFCESVISATCMGAVVVVCVVVVVYVEVEVYIYIYIAHLLCGRCGGLNGAGAGPAQL